MKTMKMSRKYFLRKNSSSPNLLHDKGSNSNVEKIKNSLILTANPKKRQKGNLAQHLLNKSVLNINNKKFISKDTNISYSFKNNKKNISNENWANMNNGFLRMTSSRQSKKTYLDRVSFLDNYLKKNHPDNIRKTLLKENFILRIFRRVSH